MFEANLLPWRDKYKAKKQSDFYKTLAVFLLVGFGAGYAYSMYVEDQRSQAQQQLEDVRAEQAELDEQLADLREFEEQQQELEAKLDALKTLEGQRYIMASRLNTLPSLLNEGVALESIESDETTMNVNGIGLDEFSVSTFMRELDGSEIFGGSGVNFIQESQIEKQSPGTGSNKADVLKFNLKVENRDG